MMDCDKAREAISSFIDGEPLDLEAAGLDAHLQTCDKCRHYSRQLAILDERLRQMPIAATDTAESSSRWARVSLALDEHDRKQSRSARQHINQSWVGRRRVLFAGLSSAAAAVVVGGISVSLFKPSSENTVASEAVNDFLTFRASGKTLHVMHEEPAKVK